MSTKKNILIGIDSSMQATKVCAWTTTGDLVGQAIAPIPVNNPNPGWAEQNPNLWWRSTQKALKELWETVESKRVLAVGIATQRDCFAMLDANGTFIRPALLSLDVRASSEVEEIADAIGREEYHQITGKPLDVTSSLARLLWLKRHEPDALQKMAKWTDVGSVLAQHLTGNPVTCYVGADSCGLVGLMDKRWISPFLEAANLKAKQFPDLVDSGTVIGKVRRAAARQSGLPEGTPVVAAGGDGQVFSIGMAANEPASLSLTLGTSIVVAVASPEPNISPLFRTLLAPNSSYLYESVLPSGTFLLRWFVETFTAEATQDEAYWDQKIRNLEPGCEGLVSLPNWWGMRFPEHLPTARGVTLGWSNQHTQAHFYRSLLEGLSFELKRTTVELRKLFPNGFRGPLHAGGGGTHSTIWCPILADVLNMPLRRNRVTESTSLGAAILAGVGAGVFPDLSNACKNMVRLGRASRPSEERVQVYQDLYDHFYLPLLDATTPLFEHH